MNITNEQVAHLAHLSKLQLTEAELKQMQADMNNMLNFVEQINELDLAEVEPLTYMSDGVNVMREDLVVQKISHDEALKNAPDKDTDYFRVPKVIKK